MCSNPVVATVAIVGCKGWHIRKYSDGMHDAVNGLAVTPGFKTAAEVVAYVKEETTA